ncbi:MAG: preprotein translocase subunit SecA, partial [Proteobacteria bacterium]
QYDDVMNQQRKIVYGMRKEILSSESQSELLEDFMYFLAEGLSVDYGHDKTATDDWNWDELNRSLQAVFHPEMSISSADVKKSGIAGLSEALFEKLKGRFAAKKEELGQFMPEVEKMFSLSTIDQLWKDHLKAMDHLREGIGLRGYAQKDPLLEYKKESFLMFKMMDAQIKQEVIAKILNVHLAPQQEEAAIERFEEKMERDVPITMSHGDAEDQPKEPVRAEPKIGRNDPCFCGSGKKYKNCHGR